MPLIEYKNKRPKLLQTLIYQLFRFLIIHDADDMVGLVSLVVLAFDPTSMYEIPPRDCL
jgi:hypothetical protein